MRFCHEATFALNLRKKEADIAPLLNICCVNSKLVANGLGSHIKGRKSRIKYQHLHLLENVKTKAWNVKPHQA